MSAERTTQTQPAQRFLRLCRKEATGLERVAARLFATPVTAGRLATPDTDEDLSERVDAFAARFGRLQDALTDKLLPAYFAGSPKLRVPVCALRWSRLATMHTHRRVLETALGARWRRRAA